MSDDKTQVRRKRSPSYPYINLRQAIDLLHAFYRAEGDIFTPVSVALKHMNYSVTSGSGARVLATLLQFGLLEEEGLRDNKRVRLSDLSIMILEAPDEEARLPAIQEAALNPDIHKELWQNWKLDENRLPSDSNMRFILLREFGFHKNAVDSFIDEFKETYSFAKLDKRLSKTVDKTLVDQSANERTVFLTSRQEKSTPPVVGHVPPGMKEHTIQLIGQPMARLILPHPLSERNLNHLVNWLNLMGPALTVPEDEYYESGDEFDDADSL